MGYVRKEGTKSSATKHTEVHSAPDAAQSRGRQRTRALRCASRRLPRRGGQRDSEINLHQLLQAAALLGGEEGRVQVTPIALVVVVLVVRADSRL